MSSGVLSETVTTATRVRTGLSPISSCHYPDVFRPQIVLPCTHDRRRAGRKQVHDQSTGS
jgi:hypothetical protein